MNGKAFRISYESVHPGTAYTDITFYNDIDSLFTEAPLCGGSAKRLYVTDSHIAHLGAVQSFLNKAEKNGHTSVIIKVGEIYKTAETLCTVLQAALNAGLNRTSVFTGIGGGVVCDICAFAASVFKRGAALELIPTTLLAMVDAAIGGKTGCDFANYKNAIGTFYPARRIYIASDFVQSLSEQEFKSGLAEVFKTALLYDKHTLRILTEKQKSVCSRDKKLLSFIIQQCVKAKAAVVEQDLTERSHRAHLNLGHTFAHALESVCGLGKINHGEAVAWGIGRAAQLSFILGYCNAQYRDDVFSVLASYGWCTEKRHSALDGIENPVKALLSAMKQDKKNSTNRIRFVLQRSVCSTFTEEIDDTTVSQVL